MKINRTISTIHPVYWSLTAIVLLAAMSASVVSAENFRFNKGGRQLTLTAGSGWAFNDSYIVIGVGAGYYVADGLELALAGEAWLGGDPDIYKISPQVKYVLPIPSRVKPYAGVFYRHIFLDGYDDLDTVGGRGGIYLMINDTWSLGGGVVYESYLDCDDTLYGSCEEIYPEITFSASF